MVHAAREAGVKRLVIVGSPQAEAFFIGDLKRQDEVDWTFVSTEGDFAKHATDEALTPTTHKAVYYAE